MGGEGLKVKSQHLDIVVFSMLIPTAPKRYGTAKMLKDMGNYFLVFVGDARVTPMYKEALNNNNSLAHPYPLSRSASKLQRSHNASEDQ